MDSAAKPDAQRQLQDMQAILGVARALAVPRELDDLLTLVLDAARGVLDAERATLFLYDPATDELYSRLAQGLAEARFPADRGVAGAAARTKQTILVPDAYADPRFNPAIDRQTGYRTRCLLGVPLLGWEGELVGVLQILNKRLGVFVGYDAFLAEALAAQAAVALQRDRLLVHLVEKKEIEHDLRLAREIQQGLLPRAAPSVPGYDVAGWSRPADETGGDCYDFLPLADGRLAVTVADASGHGVGPALMIAETRALLRAVAGPGAEAAAVLTRVNQLLCADLDDGRFVTAFFGLLDPARHRLDYASAGQSPLLWYDGGRQKVRASGATGMPLGLNDAVQIPAAPPVEFRPGDVGVLLTDGFHEAENPAREQFTVERLVDVIVAQAGRTAEDIVAALATAVEQFRGDAPQKDDMTVVVVKRTAD